MKRDVVSWLCGLIILLSIGLGMYVHFVLWPLHSQAYQITYWELIHI